MPSALRWQWMPEPSAHTPPAPSATSCHSAHAMSYSSRSPWWYRRRSSPSSSPGNPPERHPMAFSKMVKPETTELLPLEVLRTERLAPHWVRITLGGGDIEKFRPMGYDQWFRLFIPVGGDDGLERVSAPAVAAAGLDRVPAKAHTLFGCLSFLRIPDDQRRVMRNYTVRSSRPATAEHGAEVDVDFVLHGSAAEGTAGPASRWAETCV